MSYIWLLIVCGFSLKLDRSWREEITVTVVVDGDGGFLRRKHSLKEDNLHYNVDPPNFR
jgi:hypothetical protein